MVFAIMLAIDMQSLFDQNPDAAALLRATFAENCKRVLELVRS